MARFLVTGANGQVGQCLVECLKDNVTLLALDRNGLDITNREAIQHVMQRFRPDIIINAAAYTAVDRAESDIIQAEAVNVQAVQYLAEESARIGAIMLHISTDYVFDGQSSKPYKETDRVNPQNVYGRTKLAGEAALLKANPLSVILRTSWVFSEYGNNFVKTMLRLGKERERLSVVNDQRGAPTYAKDIAQALVEIAYQLLEGKTDFGIFHFSGEPHVSWYEFAQEIFRQAELQKIVLKRPLVNPINSADYPTAATRPANSGLDLTKIWETFGISPSNWRIALKDLSAYQG